MRLDIRKICRKEYGEAKWLVQNMLRVGMIEVLASKEGMGKSVLSYDLAIAVASGQTWLGRKVQQGRVLYFDEENSLQNVIQEYVPSLVKGRRLDPESLYGKVQFHAGSIAKEGMKIIGRELDRVKPDLVIVDTLQAIHESDENSSTEMMSVFRRIRAYLSERDLFNVSVVILHHLTKVGDTLRGSGVIGGTIDGSWVIKRPIGGSSKAALTPRHIEPLKKRAVTSNLIGVRCVPVLVGEALSLLGEPLPVKGEKPSKEEESKDDGSGFYH